MNDVGGSGSGTGLRAVKSSRTSDANFEYDDSEWDVGIGNLIIDLDADIEKNNEDERTTGNSGGSSVSSGGGGGNPVGESPPSSSSSSPREKSGSKTSSDKNSGNNSSSSSSLKTIGGGGEEEETLNPSPVMHIPKSPTSVTPSSNVSGGGVTTLKSGKNSLITPNSSNNSSTSIGTTTTGSTTTTTISSTISISGKSLTLSSADLVKNSGNLTSMEHTTAVGDKGLKMKIKRSKPGTKSVDAKHEIVKSDVALLSSGSVGGKNSTSLAGIEVKSSGTKEKEKVGKELVDGVPNAASANNVSSKVEEREGITGSGNVGSTNSANASGVMSDSGGKSKGTKRGSTHKKVKSSSGGNVGSGSGSVVGGGSGSNKSNSKDSNLIDSKAPSSTSISNSSSLSTSSNSHVKELAFGGATVSLSGSAFAKTASSLTSSNNSTLKAPVSTTLTNSVSRSPDALTISSGAAATLSSGTTNTVTSTSSSNAFRNAHLTTATTTSPSSGGWASGSPAKNEKAPISPSVTNQTEKLSSSSTNSPTPYGKKARVFPSNERGNAEEILSHTLTSGGGPNSSSHRTSITLSSASLNDLNTSSSSTGIMNQGGPLSSQVGSGILTSFTPGRDAKAGKASSSVSQDVCIGTSVGTVTEPDCLGPCEPGTSVTLEGIVWHETEGGVLVVNVTWRGKTYVGTLLDCTKNDWAPPRFCDSPTSDLEMRTPKNRGKRGRAQASTPVNEPPPTDTRQVNPKLRNGVKGRRGSSSNAGFATPVSPMKSEQWPKRKTRGSENESQDDVQSSSKNSKRPKVIESGVKGITSMSSKDRQSASPAPTGSAALADGQAVGPYSPALIECPEPNCSKKYKHINGLRYHQSHAHSNNFTQEDSDSNMSTASTTNANVGDSNGDRNSKTADNVDGILPSDSIDMDVDMVSTTDGENTSSAPTTPAKRPSVNSKEVNDKVYDINSDADLNMLKDDATFPTKMRVLKVPLAVPTLGRSSSGAPADKDKIDGEKVLTEAPVKEMSSSIPASVPAPVSRVPILTVPMYISRPSVNHNQEHHGTTSGRELNEKSMSSNRDDSNVIKNAGNVGLSFSGSHVISKGAPWQPHAHSIPPNVISSHVQQPVNSAVALTVPVINAKDHEKSKSSKDRSSSDSSQTKKNKHKKKSKDKDRERGRDGQKSSSSSGVNSSNAKPFTTVSVEGAKPRGLSEKRSSSLEESEKESGKGFPAEISSTGEGRDDPQSPAYSDISDANDSGAENDLTVGGGGAVKDGVKNLLVSGTSDLTVKKDAVVGLPPGHGMTPFFPSFYSPFIDPNNPPAPSSNQTLPPKLDSGRSGNLDDSPSLEGKSKVKSHSHLPPHLHSSIPPTSSTLSPDERRSPKIDYPLGSKYVPPGHYFPPQHPYYNYYDYPSGSGIMSDGSYGPGNHSRILDEKEHETQISSEPRGGHKGKSGDKSESPSLLGNIKQEPGIDKDRMKDNRVPNPLASEKEPREIKTEFGDNYVADKRPVNLLPNQHFMPCSKHSKDARRDRGEDRHERREESSKDGKGRSSAESAKNKLASERERDAEAEKEKEKNEGSKPTMETQGPPPPPTAGSYAYIPQSYLQGSPFGFPMDPSLYRQMLGPYPGSPYAVHPSMPRYPPNPGSTPLPEDLSRPTGQAPPGSAPKALDLLSHHAAQYYASHKIHELQERALKSPSPQVGSVPSSVGQNLSNPSTSPLGMPDRGGRGSIVGGTSGSNPPGLNSAGPLTSGKVADLTKDVKPLGLSVPGHPPESRSPPTQHHVHSHTHHHTHVGIGYPIIPTVPPQYSPHYGVIASPAPPPSVPASVITPFPPQKPT